MTWPFPEPQELEFFGGPMDGEKKAVPPGMQEMVVPYRHSPKHLFVEEDSKEIPVPIIAVHVYQRQTWQLTKDGPVQVRMVYKGEA